MIIESIVFIIFICSLGAILLILIRKIPVLNTLPQNGNAGIRSHKIISNVENKIKKVLVFFEKQIFMHKLLSWVKVMTLKIETKVDAGLHKIRKKAQQIDRKNNSK